MLIYSVKKSAISMKIYVMYTLVGICNSY